MGFEEDIAIRQNARFFGINLDIEAPEKINEYERMQEKMEQEQRYEEYKESGVPEKFWNESFETYICDSDEKYVVYDKVKSFAQNPKNQVLVLYGSHGCWKTHLASSVIRLYGGEYTSSSMLCLKYDSATGYKAEMTREQIILHYSKVKMLVIDECCKYFLNDQLEKFLLMQIICMR